MSDHLDVPDLKPPMNASLDITDMYVFQKPEDVNKSILVFNVNPVAPTFADAFASDAIYELKVDTNADVVAEIAYRFTFSPKEHGVQTATVRRVSGQQASGTGKEGDILFQNVPVAFGEEFTVAENGEYRFFVGMRSDPFFFDLDGYKNGMQFTGKDTFLDKNVFSMVLELPNSALGSNPRVGIWARVLIPKDEQPFFQIDRMGRPLVNVAFTKGEDKATLNHNEPIRDRELFQEKFIDLFITSGRSSEDAQQTALSLLPDILDYDYSQPAAYRNGRLLTDDIIDIQLAVLTNGAVTTDKVEPHKDLLKTFPYLGPPHPIMK